MKRIVACFSVFCLFILLSSCKTASVDNIADVSEAESESSDYKRQSIEYWTSNSNQYAIIDNNNKTIHIYWNKHFGISDPVCWFGSFDYNTIENEVVISIKTDQNYIPFLESADKIEFHVSGDKISYEYNSSTTIVFSKETTKTYKEDLSVNQSDINSFLSSFVSKYNLVSDNPIDRADFYETPTVQNSYMLSISDDIHIKIDFYSSSASVGIAVGGKNKDVVENNTSTYFSYIAKCFFPSVKDDKIDQVVNEVRTAYGVSLYGYLVFYSDLKINDFSDIIGITIPLDYFSSNLSSEIAEDNIESETEVTTISVAGSTTTETATETKITLGMQNALSKALSYLKVMAFSRSGLIEQLEYEGFSTEEAEYAVSNCGADWKQQAAKKAQSYLNTMSFSRAGLIDQLLYEGFNQEEAEYGVSAVGY